MNPDEWRSEDKLSNGGLRIRHIPSRCIFEVWMRDGEVRGVLRQGAAPTGLFNEAKEWFESFGLRQRTLL